MTTGQWLAPRYPSEEIFIKDFLIIDLNGMDVICPGCRASVKLARKTANGRIAGWCRKCKRGVML